MKIITLTEADISRIIDRVINESEVGYNTLKMAYDKLSKKYPTIDIKYDEGTKEFNPFIYIKLDETIGDDDKVISQGLLIELNKNDQFEIFYDDGYDDELWDDWSEFIPNLNSVKNLIRAIELYMDQNMIETQYDLLQKSIKEGMFIDRRIEDDILNDLMDIAIKSDPNNPNKTKWDDIRKSPDKRKIFNIFKGQKFLEPLWNAVEISNEWCTNKKDENFTPSKSCIEINDYFNCETDSILSGFMGIFGKRCGG